MAELHVRIDGHPDCDPVERDFYGRELAREMNPLVDDLQPRTTEAAPGSKGSALDWAELIVSFTGGLPMVVTAIRAWLRRREGVSITLEVDGDRITLTNASEGEREALVEGGLERHGSD